MITFNATVEALQKAGITPQVLVEESYSMEQVQFLNTELGLTDAFELVAFEGEDESENERSTFAFPVEGKMLYLSVKKYADRYPTGFENVEFQQMVRRVRVTYTKVSNDREV